MIHLSLFTGIGGFDLGFERAGIKSAGQVEFNPAARSVLRHRFPFAYRMEDIRRVTPEAVRATIGNPDIITGGFPCQDVSVAGKRAGLAGERSGLWFEFIRLIRGLQPGWVVIENVPGLLSSNGGRDFAAILRGLVECGYGVAWRVLDAQYFGVAQRRRRVFLVGHLGDGCAADVLFERESLPGNPAAGRGKGKVTAAAFTERTRSEGRTVEWQDEQAYALTNPGSGGRTNSRMVAYGGNRTGGSLSIATAVNAHPSRRYDFESATMIVSRPLAFGQTVNHYDESQQTFIASCPISPPLIGVSHDAGEDGRGRKAYAANSAGARRLTPTECERLQGFPDGWTDGQSDSARYRQLGNAVAVPVAEWIARRIVGVV